MDNGMITTSNKQRPEKALYQKLTNQILEDINVGKFGLGSRLPSQAEMVDKYGVSVNTVRQAMAMLEKQGIIRREQGRGCFVSLQANSAGRSRQLRNLGLIFERTNCPEDTPAESQMLLSFSNACRKQGIRLVVVESEFDAHLGGRALLDSFSGIPLDGVCLFLHEIEGAAERIRTLSSEFNSSVVTFPGPALLNMPMDCIDVELKSSVIQMFEYLMALGHRRIAYVGPFIAQVLAGSSHLTSGRVQAYIETMTKAAGLDESLMIETPHNSQPTRENLDRLFSLVKSEDPVTAIFAANDWMARTVIQNLWERGIYVPRDVSIIGYDDLPFSREMVPSLTTVAFPFDQMAEQAINMLKARLDNENQPLQKMTINSKPVIRDSVLRRSED